MSTLYKLYRAAGLYLVRPRVQAILAVILLTLLSHASFAQLTGPLQVTTGDVADYSYYDGDTYFSGSISWTISPAIGTVNSSSVAANKWTIYSNITWHTAGSATLSVKRGTTTILSYSVTVTCALNPTFTQPGAVCFPANVSINASAGYGGNTVRWYDASSGGNLLSTSSSYTPYVTGATTYYISTYNTSSGCETTTRVPITVSGYQKPAAPSVTPGARCGNGSVTLSASIGSGGDQIRWSDEGNANLSSNTSYATPIISANRLYYASTYNSSTGCLSPSVDVWATVNPVPSAPSTTPGAICGPGNVTLTASPGANGNSIRWYATSGGSVQSSNTTYTPSVTAPSTTFYATTYNTSTGCESGTTNALATVNPVPSTPTFTTSASAICGTGVVDINATAGSNGTQVTWYTAASGGTAFQNTLSYSPNITTSTTYYLATRNSSTLCESGTRAVVSITSNPIPSAASVTGGTRCGEGPVTLSASSGANGNSVRWYETSDGTNLLSSSSSFAPSVQSSATYYVQSYNTSTGCASGTFTPVTATANELPIVPMSGYNQFIYGSGQPTLTTVDRNTNSSVQWSEDPAANATVLQTGVSYQTPATISTNKNYYVQAVSNTTGCKSVKGTISLIVTALAPLSDVKSEVVRKKDIKSESQVDALTIASGDKAISRTFFDGLGRTLQSVVQQASPQGKDVVQPLEYDVFGRASKNYLPYVVNSTTGDFRTAYVTEQSSFYSASNDKVANDTQPYSVAIFETSPLGRMTEQGSVGQAWQPVSSGTPHTNRVSYSFNTGATSNALEEVRKLNSDGTSSSYYAANTLTRVEATDPDGNKNVTFTNGSGQVVVKKQQLDEVIDGVMVNWLETYYVYDDFGRVKYMISPKGTVALKAGSWSLSQTIKDNYTHQFVYDARGRLVEKKVPGQAWMYYAYDKLDRLVLTQDGTLRLTNQWLFIKYDQRGRAVMQGLYTNATDNTRASMQTVLDGLYVTGAWYETVGSTLEGYSNIAFPVTNKDATALTVLSVNYFDNYDFDNNGTADYTYTPQGLAGESSAISNVDGMPTRSKRKVLGTTSTWLETIIFYDKYGRTIQTKSNNHLNATIDNVSTIVYDFEGKALTSKNYHKVGANTTTVINKSEYDTQGRLKRVLQSNNGSADQLLVQYEYNELGQVVDKKLHGTGTVGSETFMQSVDYRYTINGQLASINNAQLNNDGFTSNDDTNDYFGLELFYNYIDSLGNTPLYNGNISAVKWKGAGVKSGFADRKSYKYEYDKSNRLKKATSQMNIGSAWTKEANALNEWMTYDHNGNIKTLQRNQRKHQLNGLIASYTSETADDLTFTYNSTIGDQLLKVTDASANVGGFDNGTSSTNDDYTYDINGNVTADKNKGIDSVKYNFLGKVSRIKFSDGKLITYVYDAAGSKLKMSTTISGTTTITDYVNGFVYENSNLSFFGSPEGRVVKNGSALEYQYSIADQQGNTRVVFSSVMPAPDAPVATLEPANLTTERSNYLKYDDVRKINAAIFDHTNNGSTTYSVRLSGSANETYGLARSLSVAPGDKVKAEVFAKYVDPNSANWTTALNTLMGAITSGTAGTVYDGEGYGTTNGTTIPFAGVLGHAGQTGNAPKAYLNWIVFDKKFNWITGGFKRMTEIAKENGSGVSHEKLEMDEIPINEPGYVYIYLSNENGTPIEVYFDDFKVTHTKTNIIQYNEYYPFGLQASTSWTRENNRNDFLYNAGSELNQTSGWYETFFRGYDAAIGRFLQVDPMASVEHTMSAYQYAGNNPIFYNDPTGLLKDLGELYDVIETLWNSEYGGTWSESAGFDKFETDKERSLWMTDFNRRMKENAGSGQLKAVYELIIDNKNRNATAVKKYVLVGYKFASNNRSQQKQEGPGALFDSMDDAATDWGMRYNDNSIVSGDEYGSSIYKVGEKYSYSKPRVGNADGVTPSPAPKKYKVVAYVHSHGKYRSARKGDQLTGHDTEVADADKVTVYASTPSGSLLRYDPGTTVGLDNWINVFLPSDPEDPWKVNSVDPFNLPKDEPTWGWGDWWDNLWE